MVWPSLPQWVHISLSLPLPLEPPLVKFWVLVAKAVDSTLVPMLTLLCISSWINKECTLLTEGKGSMSRVWVLTWEKESLSPMRNFITNSLAWRAVSLWFTLHWHLPQVHKGKGLRLCNWSHRTFNYVKKSVIEISPWWSSEICFCKLKIFGPFLWQKVSLKSFQISKAVSL